MIQHPVTFTSESFPRARTYLPTGCIFVPTIQHQCEEIDYFDPDSVPKCEGCGAFLNQLDKLSPAGNVHQCAICGERTQIDEQIKLPTSQIVRYLLEEKFEIDVGLIICLDISQVAISFGCIEFYRNLVNSAQFHNIFCCQLILFNDQIHLADLVKPEIVTFPQIDWLLMESFSPNITQFTSFEQIRDFINSKKFALLVSNLTQSPGRCTMSAIQAAEIVSKEFDKSVIQLFSFGICDCGIQYLDNERNVQSLDPENEFLYFEAMRSELLGQLLLDYLDVQININLFLSESDSFADCANYGSMCLNSGGIFNLVKENIESYKSHSVIRFQNLIGQQAKIGNLLSAVCQAPYSLTQIKGAGHLSEDCLGAVYFNENAPYFIQFKQQSAESLGTYKEIIIQIQWIYCQNSCQFLEIFTYKIPLVNEKMQFYESLSLNVVKLSWFLLFQDMLIPMLKYDEKSQVSVEFGGFTQICKSIDKLLDLLVADNNLLLGSQFGRNMFYELTKFLYKFSLSPILSKNQCVDDKMLLISQLKSGQIQQIQNIGDQKCVLIQVDQNYYPSFTIIEPSLQPLLQQNSSQLLYFDQFLSTIFIVSNKLQRSDSETNDRDSVLFDPELCDLDKNTPQIQHKRMLSTHNRSTKTLGTLKSTSYLSAKQTRSSAKQIVGLELHSQFQLPPRQINDQRNSKWKQSLDEQLQHLSSTDENRISQTQDFQVLLTETEFGALQVLCDHYGLKVDFKLMKIVRLNAATDLQFIRQLVYLQGSPDVLSYDDWAVLLLQRRN